jgi:hypothetical protein
LEGAFVADLKIEILHMRDPDSACEHVVFVNGERRDDIVVEDIDPGRGFDRESWDGDTQEVPNLGYSPAFRDAVMAERNMAAEYSKYIT